MEDNYYAILGVSPNASPKTITQRYHFLAKRYHPDRNPDSSRFSQISAAYSVLKDPHKRVLYNLYGNNGLLFAEYVDLPSSQTFLSPPSRLILLLLFLATFLLELHLDLPLLPLLAFPFHVSLSTSFPFRILLPLLVCTALYSVLQYFFAFDTTYADHLVLYSELILLVNQDRAVSWDGLIAVWASLGLITYFFKPRTPLGVGSFNIAIGFFFLLSMFIRLCVEDNSSWLLPKIKRIILSVKDLQYGILVLMVFWFVHGLLDAITGWSFEYITLGLEIVPHERSREALTIFAVTCALAGVFYLVVPQGLLVFLSIVIAHLLTASFCVTKAGPTIAQTVRRRNAQTVRLDRMYTAEDCCEVGRVSMSLKELCMDVCVENATWVEEIRFSRIRALVLISSFSLLVELLFCGVSGNLSFLRAFVLAGGVVQFGSFAAVVS